MINWNGISAEGSVLPGAVYKAFERYRESNYNNEYNNAVAGHTQYIEESNEMLRIISHHLRQRVKARGSP